MSDDISTHTLTWSVTRGFFLCIGGNHFNSHAHVERDYTTSEALLQTCHFNSHAHVERDVSWAAIAPIASGISTHTLTWSVTQSKFYDSKVTYDFNSHAHVERDENGG